MCSPIVALRYVDDIDSADDVDANNAPLLMCLVEQLRGGMGADERVSIGMVTICPSTGDVVWDEFEGKFLIRRSLVPLRAYRLPSDGHMRTELEVTAFMQSISRRSPTFSDKDGALQTSRTTAARTGVDETHRANAQLFCWVSALQ